MAFNAGAVVGTLKLDTRDWTSGLESATRGLFSFKKSTFGSIGAVTKSFLSLKNVLVFGIAGVGARSVVKAGIQMEASLLSLDAVARNMGKGADEAKKAAISLASDGLITVQEAAAGLKNLLAIEGIGVDKAVEAMNALKDSAAFNRQGQLEMGEAIVGATQGMKNQLSALVDNAGVTKNLSVLQAEYAKSVGKTVGQLTDAEKALANVDGVIREGQLFKGNAALAAGTLGGKITQLKTAFFELKATLASAFDEPLKRLVDNLTNATKELNFFAKNLLALPNTTEVSLKIMADLWKGFVQTLQDNFAILSQSLITIFFAKIIFQFRAITRVVFEEFGTIVQGLGAILSPIALLLGTMAQNVGRFIGNAVLDFQIKANNAFKAISIGAVNVFQIAKKKMLEAIEEILNFASRAPGFGGLATIAEDARIAAVGIDDQTKKITQSISEFVSESNAHIESQKFQFIDFKDTLEAVAPAATEAIANMVSAVSEIATEEGASVLDLIVGDFENFDTSQIQNAMAEILALREEFLTQIQEQDSGLGATGDKKDPKDKKEGGIFSGMFSGFKESAGEFKTELGKTLEAFSKNARSMGSLGKFVGQEIGKGFSTAGSAIVDLAIAGELSMKSFGNVMRQALANTLATIAAEAATRALFEAAMGLATLFINPAESAAHFGAAAMFGSIAAVGVIASKAIAPSGGGAQSSGSGTFNSLAEAEAENQFKEEDDFGEAIDQAATASTGSGKTVNIHFQATGFVDKDVMQKVMKETIIPAINAAVIEDDTVLVASGLTSDVEFKTV